MVLLQFVILKVDKYCSKRQSRHLYSQARGACACNRHSTHVLMQAGTRPKIRVNQRPYLDVILAQWTDSIWRIRRGGQGNKANFMQRARKAHTVGAEVPPSGSC